MTESDRQRGLEDTFGSTEQIEGRALVPKARATISNGDFRGVSANQCCLFLMQFYNRIIEYIKLCQIRNKLVCSCNLFYGNIDIK